MAVSQPGSVGTAARPSADTTVAEISSTLGDEEKNAVDQHDHQYQNDRGDDDDDDDTSQKIMNAAWGRHGKIYMWIGYVPLQH